MLKNWNCNKVCDFATTCIRNCFSSSLRLFLYHSFDNKFFVYETLKIVVFCGMTHKLCIFSNANKEKNGHSLIGIAIAQPIKWTLNDCHFFLVVKLWNQPFMVSVCCKYALYKLIQQRTFKMPLVLCNLFQMRRSMNSNIR